MQDQVITIQQSTQGGFEVCWLDGEALMRIFDTIAEAAAHATMVADQAYAEHGETWRINNIAA